jgi:hypothetical protein
MLPLRATLIVIYDRICQSICLDISFSKNYTNLSLPVERQVQDLIEERWQEIALKLFNQPVNDIMLKELSWHLHHVARDIERQTGMEIKLNDSRLCL